MKMSASTSKEDNMDTDPNQASVNDNQSMDEGCIFDGFANVNDFSQSALRAALQATRSSNELPLGDNFDFYSTYRSVRDVLDIEGRRVLSLLQRLLRHQNVKGGISQDAGMEIEDRFDTIMDANDQILERAGSSLDEASGIRKEEAKLVISTAALSSSPASSWNKKQASDTQKAASAYRLLTARNIQWPQLQFKDSIDNSSRPFRPLLKSKPNAIKTLDESLQLPPGVTAEDAESPDFVYPHPYKAEIEAFIPPAALLEHVTPQEAAPVGLTPLIMVATESQLEDMVTHLASQHVLAVDLEHHSYRSFQGLTCLLQISTRTHDYIVDVLELRHHIHRLNSVFTDPNITKVLHGADFDVLWLQRDFGVYLVNLFDTSQAARVLGLSRFSLAHLLRHYCQVEADKQFQLADWRIRPLPPELIKYSREDTHYLLYIYDRMRNQLLDQGNKQANLLLSVYQRSKEIALKVYQKPVFGSEDYRQLYLKSKKVFHSQQLAALRDLFAWRDHQARVEDESLGYVLPNHMLLQIAEILPRERQGVLACCNPIPPLVRQSLPEIHSFVLRARDVPVKKVEKQPVLLPSQAQHPNRYNADSLLTCPHDMSTLDRRVADLETAISETGLVATSGSMFNGSRSSSDVVLVKPRPDISAFSKPKSLSKTLAHKLAREVKALFSNPFKKYLPKDTKTTVKPMRSDVWRLKPPTGAKRKADTSEDIKDLDLDSFEPEFVVPTKRPKVAVNLLSATTSSTRPVPKPAATTSSLLESPTAPSEEQPKKKRAKGKSLFDPPPPLSTSEAASTNGQGSDHPDGAGVKDAAVSGGGASSGGVSTTEGRKNEKGQVKSLRQEVTLKKKKEKKKKAKLEARKAEKISATTTSTITGLHSSPPQDTVTRPALSQTKAKVSNPDPSGTDSTSDSKGVPSHRDASEGRKKKKRKKLTVDDVEESFTAFDYGAAETQMAKVKTAKPDIYNPSLPSRLKKDKTQRKPKLAGPGSTKNVMFGTSGVPEKQKRIKKQPK